MSDWQNRPDPARARCGGADTGDGPHRDIEADQAVRNAVADVGVCVRCFRCRLRST